MSDFIKRHKKQMITAAAALLYTLLTFVWDKGTFTFPGKDSSGYRPAVFDYCLCKVLCFIAVYFIFSYIRIMVSKERKESIAYKVTMSALVYLPVIAAVAAVKLPQGFLSNDEYSIYNDALNITHSTWFCILTPYYYTVSLMIIPFRYAPIIFKLMIQYGTAGYVTYRSKKYFGRKTGALSYLLFLLYPVIAYTTSAHRLPIYFLIYLILFTKMIFDRLENVPCTGKTIAAMLLTGAVLTQWRTEGIYLAVLIPVLLFITYREFFSSRKMIIFGVACAIAVQYIVSIPQNIFMGASLDDAANDRMKPFYAYTITNMYRNGLDTDKNSEDLAIVDRYMSLDAIEAINEHYGDINYEDVLILYQDGFIGVREDAGVQEFLDYSDALKRIFVNNPDVFIKTRIGAFRYAALPYHTEAFSGGIKGLIKWGISVVKTVSYNLFIPLIAVIIIAVYSFVKKRWFDLFVSLGLLCHWFIVFILAPASYFKYYFPVYIMAYFYILLGLMGLIRSKCTGEKKE